MTQTKTQKPRAPRAVTTFHKETFDTMVAVDLAALSGDQTLPITNAYRKRQLEALTEKYVSPNTASPDLRWSRALDKFLACEKVMESTNRDILSGLDPLTEEILVRARHSLFRWLPPVDDELLNRMCIEAAPGPGSTVGRKGDANRLAEKLSYFSSTTKEASVLLPRFYMHNPAWLARAKRRYPSVVTGDILFAAPKNAEIERVCGKQPDLNVTLQLGLWLAIEPFLIRAGLFLRDQSRGWAYARTGSVDGLYATVDLSSASDLIALELVRRLFPADWFALLQLLRSKTYQYQYPGDEAPTIRNYEKFSAMGNGFTFPLESLIFKAICDAVVDQHGRISGMDNPRNVVYGDDIIIPSECYDTLVHVLRAVGMKPNEKKSFATGPFRETCGKEFFLGVDIRPWFIPSDPVNEVELYILHNTIRVHNWGRHFLRTLAYLRSLIVNPFYQPPYYGAGEGWEDWEEWKIREAAYAFMVDTPPEDPKWHPDFQSTWWKIEGWRYFAKPSDEQGEEFFLPLSLHTGSHRVYNFRQGYWKQRSRGISVWTS